jgi:hypothetical protein
MPLIFSIAIEKTFDKIQQPFLIQALKKLGEEAMFFNIIKGI